jgi:hypothetical protein
MRKPRNLFLTSDRHSFFFPMVVCMSYCVRHWNVFGIRYQRVTGYEQWTGEHAATIHQYLRPEGLKSKPRRTFYLDGRFLVTSVAGTYSVYINVMDVAFRPKRASREHTVSKNLYIRFGLGRRYPGPQTRSVCSRKIPRFVPCFLTRTWYRTPTVTTYSVLLQISTVTRLLKGMHKWNHWGRIPGYNSNLHSQFFFIYKFIERVLMLYTQYCTKQCCVRLQ